MSTDLKCDLLSEIVSSLKEYCRDDLTPIESIQNYNRIMRLTKATSILSLASAALSDDPDASVKASGKLLSTLRFDPQLPAETRPDDLKHIESCSQVALQSYILREQISTPIPFDVTHDQLESLMRENKITHQHAAAILEFIETRDASGGKTFNGNPDQLAQYYISDDTQLIDIKD